MQPYVVAAPSDQLVNSSRVRDMNKEGPVICWLRRDLRLDDNPALHAALATGLPVVMVFVWAPEEEGQFQQGRYSRWWTKQSVSHFQTVLEQLGSKLIIRRAAESKNGLMQVVNDTGAKAVYFNHLYDPISLVRDHEVKTGLTKQGIECKSYNADLLYEPWEVLDDQQQPYTSFEPFWARVMGMPVPPPFPLPAPQQLPAVDPELFSVPVNELDWFMTPEQEASSEQLKFKWRPGVEGAVEKLEAFLSQQLHAFEHDRAKVDRNSTSQLSPWIHSGTISVRYIFYRVCQLQAEVRLSGKDISTSCKDFLQQLGYREYSRYLSFHFPFIHERSLLSHLRACPWRMDQRHFKAWRQGQTGYPLVDAAMRELWSTGWCHNRMRVVAASFMVKNLLLPWQWGLKHYWDAQMDADLECDALGWQYVSGGMADAHPFSRLIELETEAARFDPDGEYVRRWLPVLARLPTKYIHAPWTAPQQVLYAADVELGYTYPERIITAEESQANMAQACKVLESCAAAGSKGNHPYRPSTLPNSGTGPSGPSTGTGTGGKFGTDGEAKQGTGTGTGNTPAPGWPAAAPAAPAPPQGRRMVQHEVGEAASQLQGGSRRGARPRRVRDRTQQRPPEWAMHSCGGAEDDEGSEVVYARPGAQAAGAPDQHALSSSSCSDDMSDGGVSEEVVSNTVGLSAPQASGWSSLPADVDEVRSSRYLRTTRVGNANGAAAAGDHEHDNDDDGDHDHGHDRRDVEIDGQEVVTASAAAEQRQQHAAEKRPASHVHGSPGGHIDKRKVMRWQCDVGGEQQQNGGSSGVGTQTPYLMSDVTRSQAGGGGSAGMSVQGKAFGSTGTCQARPAQWEPAAAAVQGEDCRQLQGGKGVEGAGDMEVELAAAGCGRQQARSMSPDNAA